MKIYKYYKGEIHELEVRETSKLYISTGGRSAAFGYNLRFDKSEPTTPTQAILEKKNRLLTSKGIFEDGLAGINKDLNQLKVFEQEYHKSPPF